MRLPNNGASSMGMDTQVPMDDASMSMDMQGDMGAQDNMDPNMMDPNMGGDMNNEMGPVNDMGGDETMSIISQLSPKDKEAVKSYAESLISKDEANSEGNSNIPEEPMPDGLNMETPVNETFIFNKKQLNKLMENFGPTNAELEKKEKTNLIKKHKQVKSTPFNAPDFE